MDCKHADLFIMQYAEKKIEPNDAKNLTKHLLVCEDCRESFLAFDICLDEIPLVQAPADFTQNVVSRVKELDAAMSLSISNADHSRQRLSPKFIQVAAGLGAVLVGVLLFAFLNFGYPGDFFGTLSDLVQYYSVGITPFFESISLGFSGSENFSRFTFIFVPVLSVLLFVLHSTEKSDLSSGDSVEA